MRVHRPSVPLAVRPSSSDYAGTKVMKNFIDNARKVSVTEHGPSTAIAAAAKSLGSNAYSFSIPPKTLADRLSPKHLDETMYHLVVGGSPVFKNDGSVKELANPLHAKFNPNADEQVLEVEPMTVEQMRKLMTAELVPAADSQNHAMHAPALKGVETILRAFQEGGKDVKLYHSVLDGPAQVWDGFLAINSRTGEVRCLTQWTSE